MVAVVAASATKRSARRTHARVLLVLRIVVGPLRRVGVAIFQHVPCEPCVIKATILCRGQDGDASCLSNEVKAAATVVVEHSRDISRRAGRVRPFACVKVNTNMESIVARAVGIASITAAASSRRSFTFPGSRYDAPEL